MIWIFTDAVDADVETHVSVQCVCWMSRRSLSGVSNISVDESIPVDPGENNYDSSESESEHNEIEACVLTHRHVS